MSLEPKPYLRAIHLRRDEIVSYGHYPFCIPSIRTLEQIDFHPDVTFFVGENGSGKSTLLEAIAVALRFNPEGGTKKTMFRTHHSHSELHDYLKVVRSYKQPKDEFFLRAESYYNLATYMEGTGYLIPFNVDSLHAKSHGESFMALLLNRLKGHGLYLFDEPEAALSPSRQLAALSAIHQLVLKESQLIIATHSPILLAYPRAKILHFSEQGIREVAYEETEHYDVTRTFLNRHEAMLRILLQE